MGSTSLLTLVQNIGNELGRAAGTTNAGGSTTTLPDTSPDSPFDISDSETMFKNAWVKIESTGTDAYEVRRIKSVNLSTGIATTGSAFTSAVPTSTNYGIYLGVPPVRWAQYKGLVEYINDTLRNLWYRSPMLLTLVTDGDMESSGVTDWSVSNATRAKSNLSSSDTTMGAYSLGVTNSAASGYAQNASVVLVTETHVYAVSADVSVTSGTARLQLYDFTNSAVIEEKTSDQREWRRLHFQAAIPSGCKAVYVRLMGDEATAIINWDNVSLREANATTMPLPGWGSPGGALIVEPLAAANAIENVEYWIGRSVFEDSYSLRQTERFSLSWELKEDHYGSQPLALDFWPRPPASALLVATVIKPHAELSSDTSITWANADLVKAGALVRIYQDKQDAAGIAKWLPIYAEYLRAYQPRVTKRIRVGTM